MSKTVYFDTETTGLAPGQIAQLSYIVRNENTTEEAKNFFFEVKYMSQGAIDICGRDVEFYKKASNGVKFIDASDEILNDFSNSTLIAHNEKFDENFLSTEFWRINKIYCPTDRFDTMTYFKNICRIPNSRGTGYKNPKLEEVIDSLSIDKKKLKEYTIERFNITDDTGFHDARFDTIALYVALNVHNDLILGANNWVDRFRIRGI